MPASPQPQPQPHFLGMDGGRTRTTALLVDAAGRPLARVEGPPVTVDPRQPAADAAALAALARTTL
ncbi:MAG: hypothetical protein ACRELD_15260, partial [Longimicrobiales bacterium]